MKSNHNPTGQPHKNHIKEKILFLTKMKYRSRDHFRLQKAICNNCYQKVPSWDKDTHNAWLKYLGGEDRNIIHKELVSPILGH